MSHLNGILKGAGVGLDENALPPAQKKQSLVARLRGHVPADVIATSLARALNALVMPLAGRKALFLGAPGELLMRRRLLPLGQVIEGGVRFAVVGASDPTDDVGVAELVSAIGMPVRLVLVNDDDLEQLLTQLIDPPTTPWRRREAPLLDADDSAERSDDSSDDGDYDLDEGPTRVEPIRLPGEAEDPSLPMLSAHNIDSVTPLTDVHSGPATVAGPSALSVFTNTPARPVDSTEGTEGADGIDLDEGPTTRLEVPRIMLVMSGGGSDDVVEAVALNVPGLIVHRDPSAPQVLSDTSRIAVFVEVPGAPFSHGVLEGLLWRRKQLIVVSHDAGLDRIAGITRVEPDDNGIVNAIIRGIFGLP